METRDFEAFLKLENLAQNTIIAYLYAVNDYFAHYKELNKRNLVAYKVFLADNFKPKTVNLRILGVNKYLGYIGKPRLRMKTIKEQQRTYLENVISNADYEFLKKRLKMEKNGKDKRTAPFESGAYRNRAFRHLLQRRQGAPHIHSESVVRRSLGMVVRTEPLLGLCFLEPIRPQALNERRCPTIEKSCREIRAEREGRLSTLFPP